MEGLFIKVLDMSINASYLIAVVLLVRVLLPSIPKKFICICGDLAFIRHCMPFEIKSASSLVPTTMAFDSSILYQTRPVIGSGISSLDSSINQTLSENSAPALGGQRKSAADIFYHSLSDMVYRDYSADIVGMCFLWQAQKKGQRSRASEKKAFTIPTGFSRLLSWVLFDRKFFCRLQTQRQRAALSPTKNPI